MKALQKYGIDWFILSIGLLIGLAYLFPQIGSATQPVNVSQIVGYGISVIFFFYGAKLSKKQFTQGISNWKMHVLIQLTTFVLFPLIILLIRPFFSDENMWLAVFFAAALPSTVSSSVVMVSIANGNVPGAIFNATISSFVGILLTPAWVGLFVSTGVIDIDMSEVYMKLVYQILLPIVVGMILHPLIGTVANTYSKQLKILDQCIVLMVIYTSFCKSFATDTFSNFQITTFTFLLVGMLALFLTMFFVTRQISRVLKFNYEDEITTTFCGSKKSLVHGVAISKVLFATSPVAGIILLPIMLYHPMQLVFVSWYANMQQRGK